MRIQSESIGQVTVLHIGGAADGAAAASLRTALSDALRASGGRVVCDLADTDFISSDSLGVLISSHQTARSQGGYVRLVQPQRRIAEILATTQLDRLFPIFASLPAALAAG
jgi:anti-sigma B factor antagonist